MHRFLGTLGENEPRPSALQMFAQKTDRTSK
jgi:hypothetical protein